jgi:hypothetical protein
VTRTGGAGQRVLAGLIRCRARFRCPARFRARALAGVAGPVAFTAAWVAASLRQAGRPVTEIQISGLAAPGARDPWIMMTGFLVLGGSLLAFGPALRQALTDHTGAGPSDPAGSAGLAGPAGLSGSAGAAGPGTARRMAGPGPWLIEAAGVATVAAGLLRRDHPLLTSGPQSWHSEAHNAVSAVIYLLLLAIPPLLAWRLRGDPRWHGLPSALAACTVATAAILALFLARTTGPWAGTLQRIGVSIPLAALVAVATAVSRIPPPDRGSRR